MKNANIKILALLCGALVVTNVHGAYYNPNNEYDSYYDNQRYSDNDYTPHNYASKKTRSPIVPNDIRFFVSLETTLMSYMQIKESQHFTNFDVESQTKDTSINYKPFEYANFSFGIESDNGFRFGLKVVHYNTETKTKVNTYDFVQNSVTDTTSTGFAASLDIPFVKLETTIPFLRFGVGYIIVEYDDSDIKSKMTPFYFDFGLGITHNFSKNIFGILIGQYSFMPKTDVSGASNVSQYHTQNTFSINLGLGYRF